MRPSSQLVQLAARALVALHPRGWRARYGDEVLQLVEDSGGVRTLADLARGLVWVWTPRLARAGFRFGAEMCWVLLVFVVGIPLLDRAGLAGISYPSEIALATFGLAMLKVGFVYRVVESLAGRAIRGPEGQSWPGQQLVTGLVAFTIVGIAAFASARYSSDLLSLAAVTRQFGEGASAVLPVVAGIMWARPRHWSGTEDEEAPRLAR